MRVEVCNRRWCGWMYVATKLDRKQFNWPFLTIYHVPCGVCSPLAQVLTFGFSLMPSSLFLDIRIVDGFAAWFCVFLFYFFLIYFIKLWLWPLPLYRCLADWRAIRPGHTQAAASKKSKMGADFDISNKTLEEIFNRLLSTTKDCWFQGLKGRRLLLEVIAARHVPEESTDMSRSTLTLCDETTAHLLCSHYCLFRARIFNWQTCKEKEQKVSLDAAMSIFYKDFQLANRVTLLLCLTWMLYFN